MMRKGMFAAALAVAVSGLTAPSHAEIPGVELTISHPTGFYYRGGSVTVRGFLGVQQLVGVPYERVDIRVDGVLRGSTTTNDFGQYEVNTGKLNGEEHRIQTVAWLDDDIRRTVSREIVVVDKTPRLSVLVSGPGEGRVTSDPPGIDCPGQCDAERLNTTFTLTAAAADGATFTGWSGACSGTGTCTVNLTTDQWVGAWFED